MKGVLRLGGSYLVYHRYKIGLLVACLTLVLYLPLGLRIVMRYTDRHLSVRAESTPLVIGARGSPLELTFNTLYFDRPVGPTLPYGEVERIQAEGLAQAIPMLVRFRAGGHPLVGTALEYFEFRGLTLADGHAMLRLGDCVLGREAAHRLGLRPGDVLYTEPETALDLAGVYPLKLRVTGVLDYADSPDDRAVFVDVRTAWLVQGLAHGHVDLAEEGNAETVADRDATHVTATAAVRQHREVTEENELQFHFHGDPSEYPLTGIIAIPPDAKSAARLLGRYLGDQSQAQALEPGRVMEKLRSTLWTLHRYVVMGMVLLGGSTTLVVCLVFLLSLRLRRGEILTLRKMGAPTGVVFGVCAFEVVMVVVMAAVAALALAWLTDSVGDHLLPHVWASFSRS